MEHLSQVIRKTETLSSTGHPSHKTIIQRLGDIADPLNTPKQMQEGSQTGETKKHAPNERRGEIPRKRNK